jgi:hypothetical protein
MPRCPIIPQVKSNWEEQGSRSEQGRGKHQVPYRNTDDQHNHAPWATHYGLVQHMDEHKEKGKNDVGYYDIGNRDGLFKKVASK